MYDDLKRTRHKLNKPHIYDLHGRSAKAIAITAYRPGRTSYVPQVRSKRRCSGPFCTRSGFDQDGQFFGYLQFCQHEKPLNLLRDRLVSRIATASTFHCFCAIEAASVFHPYYEIGNHGRNAALLGDKATNQSWAWLWDVISMLKDVNEIERLFRVISPRAQEETHQQTSSDCTQTICNNVCAQSICNSACAQTVCNNVCAQPVCNNVCDQTVCNNVCAQTICNNVCAQTICNNVCAQTTCNNVTVTSSALSCGPETSLLDMNKDDLTSESLGNNTDSGVDDSLQQVNVEENGRELHQVELDSPWKNDNWYINGVNALVATGTCECSCPHHENCRNLFNSEHSFSTCGLEGKLGEDSTRGDIIEPVDLNYSDKFIHNPQANDSADREEILPCLNHNTSLTSAPEGEVNLSDQYPYDHMIPLCSGNEFSDFEAEFDTDFLNEQCVSDLPGPGRDQAMNSPDQDFIDTMIDTYTLSKAHCRSDSQSNLNGDDGARGDGFHFNLGLHQSWRCNDEGLSVYNKKEFSISPDPTPQDRLARITYKTQPSDAAQAPMFVFSSSSSHTDKIVSSAKAIPLDFNLNAVYKLAARDDRVADDSGARHDTDTSYVPAGRHTPDGVIGVTDLEQSMMDEPETKCRKTHDSTDRAGRVKLEKAKTSTSDNKREETMSLHGRQRDHVINSAKPYILISVLVALLATGLFLSTNKDCFSQLFWEVLMHLFLVGILLMLLITALEANNLTERAVRKLQRFLRGGRSEQDNTRQSRVVQETSEDTSPEIVSDQLFFDTQSNRQEEVETADEPEVKKGFLDGRKAKQNEHGVLTPRHYFQGAVPAHAAGTKSGVDSALLKKIDQTEAALHLAKNTNVCSNPEADDLSVASNYSSYLLDSKSLSQDSSSSFVAIAVRKDAATSSMSACSVAQTMTDLVVLESSYTQTEDPMQDYRTGSTIQIIEINPGSSSVQTASVSVQAEMDARKVYQQIERLQQKHQSALKRLQRKYLAIRRRCQIEAMNLKQCERRKNEFLCKLQLSLPTLQKEKSSLMAERSSIDKQFEDEKKKNRELVGRLTRLNQQFYRLGQIQQPPPTPPAHWRQQYQHQTYQSVGCSRAHSEQVTQIPQQQHQQQQQQQKNSSTQSQQINVQQQHQHQQQQMQHKMQQQSTLLQNQIRPNTFSSSASQSQSQQQQHHHHQQQQQQIFHQQGLPVFQLLNNKSFCQPYLEAHLQQQQQQQQQQHQQQQQQQQLHQQKMQQ